MADQRRERLQKGARRALDAAREAARDAARRARGAATRATEASRHNEIHPSTPSTPPVERFTTTRRTAERSVPPPFMQTTPPRPRRGENRLTPLPPALRIPGESMAAERVQLSSDEAELIDLIDRLAAVADGSGLAEIEVAAGATRVLVRSRAAVAGRAALAPIVGAAAPVTATAMSNATPTPTAAAAPAAAAPAATEVRAASGPFVNAPLTGIFYAAAAPGADPLITVGQSIAVGDLIGLIEAMKLFNEIKSDKAGRVRRMIAENGRIVKSKTPILELEP